MINRNGDENDTVQHSASRRLLNKAQPLFYHFLAISAASFPIILLYHRLDKLYPVLALRLAAMAVLICTNCFPSYMFNDS